MRFLNRISISFNRVYIFRLGYTKNIVSKAETYKQIFSVWSRKSNVGHRVKLAQFMHATVGSYIAALSLSPSAALNDKRLPDCPRNDTLTQHPGKDRVYDKRDVIVFSFVRLLLRLLEHSRPSFRTIGPLVVE